MLVTRYCRKKGGLHNVSEAAFISDLGDKHTPDYNLAYFNLEVLRNS